MEVYHTQEKRSKKLTAPKKCTRDDAWLGEAYYFWKDEKDAENWGYSSKKRTGSFEIYTCNLSSTNYLDTVFNEKHYNFWISQLEKIHNIFLRKTSQKPSIKELNDYIQENKIWKEVDYIQFQDLPIGKEHSFVKPIEYKNGKLTYVSFRKRIQIAVYNPNIISNFTLYKTI
jgi:hypothetical protein